MKKILISSIVVLMLIIPVAGASNMLSTNNAKIESPSVFAQEDFTHTVIVESGTQTTCPYCVTAASQLYSIHNAGDLDFHYVALLWDGGHSRVRDRLKELDIYSIPDVYFDGLFTHVSGAQTDELPYRNAITQAGAREVADIDLDVDVVLKTAGTLKITVTVYNNEPEDYSGRLITYIVEKESRWNDNGGNPYHYAVLDIPIDDPLVISRSQAKSTASTHTFTKTWYGAVYGFSDITQDNIEVVAAMFDADTGLAVESASGAPTSGSTNHQTPSLPVIKIITEKLMDRFPLLARLLIFN